MVLVDAGLPVRVWRGGAECAIRVGPTRSSRSHLARVAIPAHRRHHFPAPCQIQGEEFRSGVFELVPARDYSAVTALAELADHPEVDKARLCVAAVQEHKQNRQTRRLVQGTSVTFGARVQVGIQSLSSYARRSTDCGGDTVLVRPVGASVPPR